MLVLDNISYDYQLANRRIPVLKTLSHTFAEGSFSSIQAPSGSGKTTLLNLLGLLDSPSAGSYHIAGEDTSQMNDRAKSLLRAEVFGFLFQNFRLIPSKTVLDNICLALEIAGINARQTQEERSMAALEQVGLAARAQHLPPELSGGESQRVAFARALAKSPQVLLADEPTGNLDNSNRDQLLDLMDAFHQQGKTIIMVTHDTVAAQRAQAQLNLHDFALQS